MASRRAEFLAAHDRTQNGREVMASRRAKFIAACDLTVKIPMRPGVDSLNVAAAAAVACWQATRPS